MYNQCEECIVHTRRIKLNHIAMYEEWNQIGLEVSKSKLMVFKLLMSYIL